MLILDEDIVERLIEIEASIRYDESPTSRHMPYVVIARDSSIILSAPHGARTFRNNGKEVWHEEDEYTAGMALLLSGLCGTSVIATSWRTDDSDPNEHDEERSVYKREVRHLIGTTHVRWFIDLHGAGEDSPSMSDEQRIDLGMGRQDDYLPTQVRGALISIAEKYLGKGATDRKGKPGFKANDDVRLAAFTHKILGIHSVQIEMKPSVRVPVRRVDSSMYPKDPSKFGGPYTAKRQDVLGMMQALVEFIEYLKSYKESE